MQVIDDINKQYDFWKKGLLTYNEMLNNIIQLAENEKSYVIEYKASKGRPWKLFTETIYTLTEAKEEIAIEAYKQAAISLGHLVKQVVGAMPNKTFVINNPSGWNIVYKLV